MSILNTLVSIGGYLFFLLLIVIGAIVLLEKYLAASEFKHYGGEWSVTGKVVLVTGASSGIGEEMAKACARRNAHVVLTARREDRLNVVKADCEKLGALSVLVIAGDVAREADCKRICEQTAAKHERIDVLFANAGIGMAGMFADQLKDMSIFTTLMATNFFGVLWMTAYALPALKRSIQGKIIAISSIQGKVPLPGRTGYIASKFALHGLMDSLRQELRPDKVSVLIACPGPVQTEINTTRLGTEGKTVALDMKKAMPVDECVRRILAAAACHQREELFVPLQKIAPYLVTLVPRITELIAQNRQRNIHRHSGDPAVEAPTATAGQKH